jgi:hypothetical protein
MSHGITLRGRGSLWVSRLLLGLFAAVLVSSGSAQGQEPTPEAAARQPRPVNVAHPAVTGGPWINTPNGKAIDLKERKGKVTILHFWTFG